MSARSATGVSGGASPGWRSGLPWAVCLVVLLLIPFFVTSRAAFVIMNTIAIYMVFALSYNILLGQAGMLSFGSAVFYGVGGYAAIHAMNAIGLASEAGSGFWAFFPVYFMPLVGFLAGAVVAFVIGWPCVKKGGVAFAMITLGVGELIATGNATGIHDIRAGQVATVDFGPHGAISGRAVAAPPLDPDRDAPA